MENIKLADNEIYLEIDEFTDYDGDNPTTYKFNIKTIKNELTVGRCSFRIGTPDNRHIKYGGNIGYDIDEEYRGNKYSLKACKLLLSLAESQAMKSIFIACEPSNKASRRICELLGAKHITIIDLPEDDYNYIHHGTKQHCVYELKLNI